MKAAIELLPAILLFITSVWVSGAGVVVLAGMAQGLLIHITERIGDTYVGGSDVPMDSLAWKSEVSEL